MRAIKFRAWTGKKMLSHEWMRTSKWLYDDLASGNGCRIMQYTGLKDKNGKEIYDGDIVSFWNGTLTPILSGETYSIESVIEGVNYRLSDNKKGIISYQNASFFVGSINVPKYFGALGHRQHLTSDCIEVIGNIYEHPELLEETK